MGVDYVGRVGPRPAPPEEAERTTGTERPARPRAVEPAGRRSPASEDRWEGQEQSPEEQEEETAAREEGGEDVPDGKAEGEGEGAEEAEDSEEVEGGEGEAKRGRRLDRRA